MFPAYYLNRPIESLQTMLQTISDHDPNVLPVIPDGVFGRGTYASVLSFQKTQGLPPTGDLTPETWAAVARVYQTLYPKNTPVLAEPVWETNRVLMPNDSNYHLFLIQGLLAALSFLFADLPKPELTGMLDTATQTGLRWVQQASDLEPTGALDTQTWYYLTQLYRTVIGDGTAFKG